MARILTLLLLLGVSRPLFAQNDPLRPAAGFAAGEAVATSAESAEALQLQSVLIAGRHREALINGQPLTPGQTIRGYRLVSVDEHGARLVGPEGPLELKLLSVQIRTRSGASSSAPHKPTGRKP